MKISWSAMQIKDIKKICLFGSAPTKSKKSRGEEKEWKTNTDNVVMCNYQTLCKWLNINAEL